MTDNELIIAIRSELLFQLSSQGLGDILVKQSYQPTQQSVPNERIIYIHKITNPQVGTGFTYSKTTRTQNFMKRATFQFDALAQQDPSDLTSLTAGDIINIAADLLQSYDAIRNLKSKGVSIERVTDVRPSYFVDDKDRFESSPSFDLTVNYNTSYTKEVSAVEGLIDNNDGI